MITRVVVYQLLYEIPSMCNKVSKISRLNFNIVQNISVLKDHEIYMIHVSRFTNRCIITDIKRIT